MNNDPINHRSMSLVFLIFLKIIKFNLVCNLLTMFNTGGFISDFLGSSKVFREMSILYAPPYIFSLSFRVSDIMCIARTGDFLYTDSDRIFEILRRTVNLLLI